MLTSLDALFKFLRIYHILPQYSLRVFSAYSREELNEQLAQENNGLESWSVTAEQFLQARGVSFSFASPHSVEADLPRSTGDIQMETLYVPHSASMNESGIPIPAVIGSLSMMDRRRLELEMGAGGDHDVPYTFSVSVSTPQTLAWMRLLAKVQRGELEP